VSAGGNSARGLLSASAGAGTVWPCAARECGRCCDARAWCVPLPLWAALQVAVQPWVLLLAVWTAFPAVLVLVQVVRGCGLQSQPASVTVALVVLLLHAAANFAAFLMAAPAGWRHAVTSWRRWQAAASAPPSYPRDEAAAAPLGRPLVRLRGFSAALAAAVALTLATAIVVPVAVIQQTAQLDSTVSEPDALLWSHCAAAMTLPVRACCGAASTGATACLLAHLLRTIHARAVTRAMRHKSRAAATAATVASRLGRLVGEGAGGEHGAPLLQ
jgi:hypothetical protein